MDTDTILRNVCKNIDEDILSYLVSVIDDMSFDEKRNISSVSEVIAPFLLDSGGVTEIEAENICKNIVISFGGSGLSRLVAHKDEEEDLALLSAPIKIIDNTNLKELEKRTFGGAVLSNDDSGSVVESFNSALEIKSVLTTQKQIRKQRKENEVLRKILKQEEMIRKAEAEEMAQARMAAIKASRLVGKQSSLGVNIERLSLPHPSGTGDLLSDVPLTLVPGRRYGLIGRNGAGKSTLLRSFANYKIDGLSHLRILLVDQHVEGDDLTPLQWVLNADVERTSLLGDEERLTLYLHGTDNPLPDDLKGINLEVALTECYERMDQCGVSSAEVRAKKILYGLGFDDKMINKPTEELSGGWCMRCALASAIFVKPNLLLLDEPTNHLDLHALVWLENWLNEIYEGICVVVSHDRFFLDCITTDVLELKSSLGGNSKGSLEHYSGDYCTYENTVEEWKKQQIRAREAVDKQKEKLKEFISREGKKYDNPAHQSQRKMKIKQLEALVDVEALEEDSHLVMNFPEPNGVFEEHETLVEVSGPASFGWPNQEALFNNAEFNVKAKARMVILGKNGCGKTCLLQILVGELFPTKGRVSRHAGARIAMLQQHHYRGDQLDPNLSALDHIRRLPPDEHAANGLQDPGSRFFFLLPYKTIIIIIIIII